MYFLDAEINILSLYITLVIADKHKRKPSL